MIKTRKYRIYPTQQQRTQIMQNFGCVRVVYNACIDDYNLKYKEWKDNGKQTGQLNSKPVLVSVLKKEKPWLANADSLSLSAAVNNFTAALKAFHDSRTGKRKGRKTGFPKYKKRGKTKYAYETCNQGDNIRFDQDNTHVKLPKLGWVEVVKHRPMPDGGTIKRVYVTMNAAEEFYVTMNVECSDRLPLVSKVHNADRLRAVGLDMSMSSFCVSSDASDDTITKYIRNYRKEEQHLKNLDRRLSLKEKYRKETIDGKEVKVETKNHRKARIKRAKAYLKVARRRKEFCIKMARYFAMKYDVVCIEDLDMQAMSRTLRLGKSVMDIGWGMFTQWLEYECLKYDTVIIKADKWYPSSKTCNHCGHVNKELRLSDREWVCPECGEVISRDRNAACNLRDYAVKKINSVGTSECNDRGMLTTLRETFSGVMSARQGVYKTESKEAANSLV